jgi:hypothetical protein
LHQVLLDVFERHGLHKRLDIDLLCLEHVQEVCKSVEGA